MQNNVISANYEGVGSQTSTPSTELQHDVFQGNLIGTDKTGRSRSAIRSTGFDIESGRGITIGGTGPGQGNVIANNGYYGIYLLSGQQVQITRNSIFGNAKQRHLPGLFAERICSCPPVHDIHAGDGKHRHTLGHAHRGEEHIVRRRDLLQPDGPSSSEQGQTFVKDVTVTTDGTGQGSFSLTEPTGFYTATTTDPLGDTSEFSNVAGTAALPGSVTTVSSSANPSTPGQQVTFTAVVTAPGFQGTPTGTVTFTIDGQAQTPVPLVGRRRQRTRRSSSRRRSRRVSTRSRRRTAAMRT